jgi:hypothetical protein
VPRTCTICKHERIEDINNALVGSKSYRSIAKRFEASESAMYRHQQDHLPQALSKAKEAAQAVEAGTLFERLGALNRETQEILREAREAGNHAIALGAISRAEKQLELEARLLGELDDRVKVAVGVSVEANNSQHLGALLAEVMLPSELEDIRNRLMAACARKVNPTVVATVSPLLPSGGTSLD